MNRFLMAMALAAAAATPALAQPLRSSWHASAGYAATSPVVHDEEGNYAGRDPDANVRLQLYKDANSM